MSTRIVTGFAGATRVLLLIAVQLRSVVPMAWSIGPLRKRRRTVSMGSGSQAGSEARLAERRTSDRRLAATRWERVIEQARIARRLRRFVQVARVGSRRRSLLGFTPGATSPAALAVSLQLADGQLVLPIGEVERLIAEAVAREVAKPRDPLLDSILVGGSRAELRPMSA